MNNVNTEMCSACKGKCCKHMPGLYSPNDFKEPITKELIINLLQSNTISIDWWDGDIEISIQLIPLYKQLYNGKKDEKIQQLIDKLENKNFSLRTYFIRPRIIDSPILHPSWGGQCINLTENGCSLKYENRPQQCRDLIPDYNFETNLTKCFGPKKSEKPNLVLEWKKYQSEIIEALKELNLLTSD